MQSLPDCARQLSAKARDRIREEKELHPKNLHRERKPSGWESHPERKKEQRREMKSQPLRDLVVDGLLEDKEDLLLCEEVGVSGKDM